MYVHNTFKQLHNYSKWPSKMLGRTVRSSFQPTGMQDLMLGGKSCSYWSKCGFCSAFNGISAPFSELNWEWDFTHLLTQFWFKPEFEL